MHQSHALRMQRKNKMLGILGAVLMALGLTSLTMMAMATTASAATSAVSVCVNVTGGDHYTVTPGYATDAPSPPAQGPYSVSTTSVDLPDPNGVAYNYGPSSPPPPNNALISMTVIVYDGAGTQVATSGQVAIPNPGTCVAVNAPVTPPPTVLKGSASFSAVTCAKDAGSVVVTVANDKSSTKDLMATVKVDSKAFGNVIDVKPAGSQTVTVPLSNGKHVIEVVDQNGMVLASSGTLTVDCSTPVTPPPTTPPSGGTPSGAPSTGTPGGTTSGQGGHVTPTPQPMDSDNGSTGRGTGVNGDISTTPVVVSSGGFNVLLFGGLAALMAGLGLLGVAVVRKRQQQ